MSVIIIVVKIDFYNNQAPSPVVSPLKSPEPLQPKQAKHLHQSRAYTHKAPQSLLLGLVPYPVSFQNGVHKAS